MARAAIRRLTRAMDDVAEVDPTSLPTDCVTDLMTGMAKVDGRLEGVMARFVAVAEAADLPGRAGAASTTSWVADVTGRSRSQAGRTGKLARTVAEAPQIADAVASGALGPDQGASLATALSRGVLDARDADALLDEARVLPPGPFATETRRREARRDQRRMRADEQGAHERRYFRTWRTEDQSLQGEFRLSPAAGDTFQTALESLVAPDGVDVPDEARRTPTQLRADALTDLADHALSTCASGKVGGVRPHVTVTVEAAMLLPLDEAEAAGAVGETALGTTLSASATRKLLCDASFRRLVVGPEGQPLDIGRAERKWPAPIRTAIAAVDGACRAPGCELPPDRCIVHHIRFWKRGGDTSVDNGVLLCNHGHDLVHDHGWSLEMDPVTRICTWTSPTGEVRTTAPRGAAAQAGRVPLSRSASRPTAPVDSRPPSRPPPNADTTTAGRSPPPSSGARDGPPAGPLQLDL